ncbi:hypothetical protein P43SY_011205 [Pythium insidiosum]|uniref:Tc1-like transposase DDE domain-containing protein n=1 Tax=Pythium insidiosum TaxID=114742 RepID=A0AAD5LA23_PYTIN|nr:hypothetical protein P43SY_011205 [Pythium insidiosum]
MDRTLALTKKHKEARLALARQPDEYKEYWRDLGREPRQYVQSQNGGGSVMVWGAFCAKGISELAVLAAKQRSHNYVWTLSESLLPFAHLHYGTEFLFQQDNAPIHTSAETRAFLAEQGVQLMEWPARSPDLNPIENLWAILSRKMYENGRLYDSVSELREAIILAWKALPHSISKA